MTDSLIKCSAHINQFVQHPPGTVLDSLFQELFDVVGQDETPAARSHSLDRPYHLSDLTTEQLGVQQHQGRTVLNTGPHRRSQAQAPSPNVSKRPPFLRSSPVTSSRL